VGWATFWAIFITNASGRPGPAETKLVPDNHEGAAISYFFLLFFDKKVCALQGKLFFPT
jgi:hypothetical protein